MNILITGAFGTVGRHVVSQAFKRGHVVSVLEIDTPRNRRTASRLGKSVDAVFFGDIRNEAVVKEAVEGQDAIVHLAAILPPTSETKPELCRSVNIGGTKNVISAIKGAGRNIAVVLVSSASVMGPTQDREPPLRASDPVAPNDEYARSKVEAEAEVLGSGLPACVLRLAAVMPTTRSYSLGQVSTAFDLPLDARCEAVVDVDVATACVRAAESLLSANADVRGSTFFIGGGKEGGWQMRVREMYRAVFEPIGVTLPPDRLFTTSPNRFSIDWYDTDKAQKCFAFQNHTLSEYRRIVLREYRLIRPVVVLARPLLKGYLARQSPYRPRRPAPALRRPLWLLSKRPHSSAGA